MTTTQPMPTLAGMKRGLLDVALAGYDDDALVLPLRHLKAAVAALDAVLAVKFDTHVNSWSTDTDHGFAQGMALAKERVFAAISAHVALGSGEVR